MSDRQTPSSQAPPIGGGDSLSPPPPPPREVHWASDPRKRRLVWIAGPVILLGRGLWKYRHDSEGIALFLMAFPLASLGIVLSVLWLGELGAARYEGRTEPRHHGVLVLVALGVAAASIPIAAGIREGVNPITFEVVVMTLVGAGIVRLMFAYPDATPNLLLVPLATLVGAGMGAFVVVLGAIGSTSGALSAESDIRVLIAWVVTGLVSYLGLTIMTDTNRRGPLTTTSIVNGALATLVVCVLGFFAVSFALDLRQ